MKRALVPIFGLSCLWVYLVSFSLWNRDFFRLPEQVAVQSDHIREALVARNWMEGKGWTTPIFPLYSLNLYRQMGLLTKGPPWPNSERFPLPVLIAASLMHLFGKSGIVAVLLYNLIFQFLALLGVYWLALKVFKDHTVAFLAGLLFMMNPAVSSSLVDGKSGPDLFMAILSLTTLFAWLRRPSLIRCVSASLICGLTFLMRYNIGAVVMVTSLLMFAILYSHPTFPYLNRKVLVQASVYVIVFLAVLSPLFAYSEITFHKFFFALNSQLQFSNATRLVAFTDPWWKLEGPVRDMPALRAFCSYPLVFLPRFAACMFTGLIGLFLLGSQPYLWPLFGYQAYEDNKKSDGVLKIVAHPISIFGAVALLEFFGSLLLTAPFSGSNSHVYLFWSYIPIQIGAAAGAVTWWRRSGKEWARAQMKRLDGVLSAHRMQIAVSFIIFVTLVWNTAYFLAHRLQLNLVPIYSGIVFCAYFGVVLLAGAFCAILYFRKPFVGWIYLILLLLFPISLKYFSQPYMTIEDANVLDLPQAFNDIRAWIGPHEIVLSTQQSVFSWFADRPCLGIPEYPELITSLLNDYRLPIRAIFLFKTKFFVDAVLRGNWNYGFSGYSRIVDHFYPIPGFVLKKVYWPDYEKEGPALLYMRDDSVPLSSLIDTREIHFGDPKDAIHLIHGWSQADSDDNHKVAFIFRRSNKKIGIMGNSTEFTSKPASEGEFTFMLRPPFPKEMKLTFKSPITQRMDVYLNHDLTHYEGLHELNNHRIAVNLPLTRDQWTTLSIPLPQEMLREGLNKIGLSFPDCNMSDLAIRGKTLLKIPGILFKENTTDRDVVLRGDTLHQFRSEERAVQMDDSTDSSEVFSYFGTSKRAVSFVCAAVDKADFVH